MYWNVEECCFYWKSLKLLSLGVQQEMNQILMRICYNITVSLPWRDSVELFKGGNSIVLVLQKRIMNWFAQYEWPRVDQDSAIREVNIYYFVRFMECMLYVLWLRSFPRNNRLVNILKITQMNFAACSLLLFKIFLNSIFQTDYISKVLYCLCVSIHETHLFQCCHHHFQCTEDNMQLHTQFPSHNLPVSESRSCWFFGVTAVHGLFFMLLSPWPHCAHIHCLVSVTVQQALINVNGCHFFLHGGIQFHTFASYTHLISDAILLDCPSAAICHMATKCNGILAGGSTSNTIPPTSAPYVWANVMK